MDAERVPAKRKLPSDDKSVTNKYQKSLVDIGGSLSSTKSVSGVLSSGANRLSKGKSIPEKYDDNLVEMSVTEGKLFWAICMFRDVHVQALIKRFLARRLEKVFLDGKIPSADIFVKQALQLLQISFHEKSYIPPTDWHILRVCIPGLMLIYAGGDASTKSYSSYLNESFGLDEQGGGSLISNLSVDEVSSASRKVDQLLSIVSLWSPIKQTPSAPSRPSGTEM